MVHGSCHLGPIRPENLVEHLDELRDPHGLRQIAEESGFPTPLEVARHRRRGETDDGNIACLRPFSEADHFAAI